MKFRIFNKLLSSALLVFGLMTSAQAIDFGGIKEKAAAAAESASGSQLTAIGKSLYSAFSGNELATKYAKSMTSALQTGKYSQVFDYYQKLKKANLSPEQLTSWNGIKNTISAFVLENGISSDDTAVADLLERTSKVLKENNIGTATSYLTKLKNLGEFSKSDKSLLSQIQENLAPLVLGK